MTLRSLVTLAALLLSAYALPLEAQSLDSTYYQNLHWRMIGPYRGGRTVGAAGIPDRPNLFYIGVNNGGVWRTNDFGRTWDPIFDSQRTGSIGALAVAPSNPKIIYVGTGEGLLRPDLSVGDGMFRSTDEGATWTYLGLSDAQQIGAIIVDPRDPNRLFVAVLGHPYGPNEERGVFRSTNGGSTWEKVLYKDENTGAIALAFDPKNPNILFADLWASRLAPWENGQWQGKNSGMFKSTDGGTSWRQLTKGLPSTGENLGRIGFAIAPSDPARMYALVDAGERGGVYRSDDAGESWTRVNKEGRVWSRGSDFAEVKVHPRNKEILYVANTSAYRSTDGGSTFSAWKGAPGGDDYHTIWINPKSPEIIVLASDQGATITVNEGRTWSSWYNQPTAQFFHVITDNQFPYNVYGSQQESGSVGTASRGNDGGLTFREWHTVGADEWSYIAPDPLHPNWVYGSKGSRYDKVTGQVQSVAPEAIRSGKYRFLRTAPLMFSPVNPRALYLASNVLFKTTTAGENWEIISPDLSRDTLEVPDNIGIYRTPDMARQARRGVIYALGLSPIDEKIIWAGTDDGLLHRTADGGAHWVDVTPPSVTAWSKIATIDAGHADAATAYVAVNRIRLDDIRPHIFRTRDNGTTWKEIVRGLPADGPVNVVREDPVQQGLLLAGTERAVFVSFDDGENWLPLRLNMPATSIRDLVIHQSDVVVGTHGRSFWVLDNITELRQMCAGTMNAPPHLFTPDEAIRVRWNTNTDTPVPPEEPAGENPPDGAMIDYVLPLGVTEASLEIRDDRNALIRRFSSRDTPETVEPTSQAIPTYWFRPSITLSAAAGAHRFVWDLHYPPPESLPREFPIAAVVRNTASQPTGPWVLPGAYTVSLDVDGKRQSRPLTVRMDPRVSATGDDLRLQFDLSKQCYDGLEQLRRASGQLNALRKQLASTSAGLNGSAHAALKDSAASLDYALRVLKGDGVPRGVGSAYFTAPDGSSMRESFGGMQTKLLTLLSILQDADAKPTRVQIASVKEQMQGYHALLGAWQKFPDVLTNINRELERAGVGRLKIE